MIALDVLNWNANNGELTRIGLFTYAEVAENTWTVVAGADPSMLELDPNTSIELDGNSKGLLPEDRTIDYDEVIPMGIALLRLVTNLVPIGSAAVNGNVAPAEPRIDRPEDTHTCP